jgi:tripartite-type tricarboxylate transporter receptor subunit TctC
VQGARRRADATEVRVALITFMAAIAQKRPRSVPGGQWPPACVFPRSGLLGSVIGAGNLHLLTPPGTIMRFSRRRFLHLAGVAALPIFSQAAAAQAVYPNRPVRIVVGFAPGGGVDVTARLIGQALSERLGQQFVIENRPGAGTNIGTEAVVNAVPDGYTLLLATNPNAVNATLYEKLNFNFIRDIAPIAMVSRVPNVMEVHPSFPATTIGDFVAYAKAHPGQINFASAGIGASGHMAGEMFKAMTGIDRDRLDGRGFGTAIN